jgi:hypothetical protein
LLAWSRATNLDEREGRPWHTESRDPPVPEVLAVSWDLYVLNFPPDAASMADIPADHDYDIGMARSVLIERIKEVVPEADFADPGWGRIELPDASIEVNIGDDDPVPSFALMVHDGSMAAGVVADILDHLGLRAADGDSESGFFDRGGAEASFATWRAYRDQVMGLDSGNG